MAPETSQTVPEKPRDRVSVEEDDVPNERECQKKEFRSTGVQEFRSCRIKKTLLGALKGSLDGNTPKFCNS
jgi:hypothetical protein